MSWIFRMVAVVVALSAGIVVWNMTTVYVMVGCSSVDGAACHLDHVDHDVVLSAVVGLAVASTGVLLTGLIERTTRRAVRDRPGAT